MAIWELLPDNIALMEHLEALPGAAGGAWDMPQQREVPSLLIWVASFVMCGQCGREASGEDQALLANMCLERFNAMRERLGELQSYVRVHSCNR